MMASRSPSSFIGDESRAILGHLSEYQRLVTVLGTQPGLVVLAADPLSGASALVRLVLKQLDSPVVYVDARGALDEIDLGMAIADAAVAALNPQASAWWAGSAPPSDREGLRLHRALSRQGIDIEDVRIGSGPGSRVLDVALELTAELADGPVVLALDHLDGVASRSRQPTANPLATLRGARQRLPNLNLLLVGRSRGPVERALSNSTHPLYRGGQLEHLARADPRRFVADLAIAPQWTDAPVATIRVAADLVAGAPAYVWAIVDLATAVDDPDPVAAWSRLRALTDAHTAAQFDMVRAVHPIAQPVVTSIAVGLGPYGLPLNDGRIRSALQNLAAVGAVWQPSHREWAIADPLLTAWCRDHTPPWIRRRSRAD
jgi:hypothetical protein